MRAARESGEHGEAPLRAEDAERALQGVERRVVGHPGAAGTAVAGRECTTRGIWHLRGSASARATTAQLPQDRANRCADSRSADVARRRRTRCDRRAAGLAGCADGEPAGASRARRARLLQGHVPRRRGRRRDRPRARARRADAARPLPAGRRRRGDDGGAAARARRRDASAADVHDPLGRPVTRGVRAGRGRRHRGASRWPRPRGLRSRGRGRARRRGGHRPTAPAS